LRGGKATKELGDGRRERSKWLSNKPLEGGEASPYHSRIRKKTEKKKKERRQPPGKGQGEWNLKGREFKRGGAAVGQFQLKTRGNNKRGEGGTRGATEWRTKAQRNRK